MPIVAMTAHAMAGDRDRCIAAGMDEYITKPLLPDDLVRVVERATVRHKETPEHMETTEQRTTVLSPQTTSVDGVSSSVESVSTSSHGVFDMKRALARLGGDRRLLREMIAIFRAESSELMAAIRVAARGGNAGSLGQSAHTLKGALGTLDAPDAFQAARRLEDVAREGQIAHIGQALSDLERAMRALARALAPSRRATIGRSKGASHAVIDHKRRPGARRRR